MYKFQNKISLTSFSILTFNRCGFKSFVQYLLNDSGSSTKLILKLMNQLRLFPFFKGSVFFRPGLSLSLCLLLSSGLAKADVTSHYESDINFVADRTIAGKVTDESGATLPGVSIVLKGSSTGTVSNTEVCYS